jgi:hypothetical protein
MRRSVVVLLAVVAILAGAFAIGSAAAKSYQFTGTVKSVDGNTFTVEKSAKETWVFESASDMKGGTPKAGDKVTVYYKMVATEIEAKGAAAGSKTAAAGAAPAASAPPKTTKKK